MWRNKYLYILAYMYLRACETIGFNLNFAQIYFIRIILEYTDRNV